MATMMLLNDDGTLYKKLRLVSLPTDYQVPEGKILSWRMVYVKSYNDPAWRIHQSFLGKMVVEPPNAYFYFGEAWAEISVQRIAESLKVSEDSYERIYNVRKFTVTVQGKSGTDVNALRDKMLEIFYGDEAWKVHNDLNPPAPPKPFGKRLKERLRGALSLTTANA